MSRRLRQSVKWDSCYTDPERGIAFFDGVRIVADAITDPRWDRVLPLLEEEQVYMCRQMTPALRTKKGGLVLDVGTGSGVFAIWAAKHRCRVIAIDINPRALTVAEENARANGVAICVDLALLEPGQIYFSPRAFNSEFAETNEARFDVVFLSPPYSPTWKPVKPALHAEAGEGGQQVFIQQINLVPSVLKKNGVCIGNQMTPVDSAGVIQAEAEINRAFRDAGRMSTVRLQRIIESDVDTESFLRDQYRGFSLRKADALECYVKRVSEQHPKLALIYYEAYGTNSRADRYSILNKTFPKQKWDDRATLHRNIVEHTATEGFLPLPSILTERFCRELPEMMQNSLLSETDQESRWLHSRLRLIDSYIRWRSSWKSCHDLFDLLFIDTAPIYPSLDGTYSIKQECKIWLQPFSERFEDVHAQRMARNLLEHWQMNTLCQQRSFLGPFLHPSFTGDYSAPGLLSPIEWAQMNYSTTSANREPGYAEVGEQQNHLEQYARILDSAAVGITPAAINKKIKFDDTFGYSYAMLGDLAIPNPETYYAELCKPTRPAIHGHAHLFEHGLKAQSQDPDEDRTKRNILEKDLGFCHLTMHKSIDRRFEQILKTGFGAFKWSSLLGIPLFIHKNYNRIPNDIETSAQDTIPRFYRGGIWIYARSSRSWTLEHENLLFDLARLSSILYLEKYSLDNVTSRVRSHEELLAHGARPKLHAMMTDSRSNFSPTTKAALISLDTQIQVWSPEGYKIDNSELWDKRDSDVRGLTPELCMAARRFENAEGMNHLVTS